MRRFGTALALSIPLLAAVGAAHAETVIVSLSHHQVRITSTYTGAELVVFGIIGRDGVTAARSGGYDLVVTARGPRAHTVVREKRPFGPVWLNAAQVKFYDLPVTKAVLSNRPLDEIADPDLRRRFGIGLDASGASKIAPSDTSEREAEFHAAMLRLKTRSGLYIQNERGVSFLTDSVFRAAVPVPATAPLGSYEVEAALFHGGVRLAVAHTHFEVSKTGMEQILAREARERGLLYGATASALALVFGWLATVVFRRD